MLLAQALGVPVVKIWVTWTEIPGALIALQHLIPPGVLTSSTVSSTSAGPGLPGALAALGGWSNAFQIEPFPDPSLGCVRFSEQAPGAPQVAMFICCVARGLPSCAPF